MLSKLAAQGTEGRFVFPRPMTDRPGLDFSFSGLKTFAANTIRNNEADDQTRADIARAFEDAVVDTLMIKCKRALDQTGFKRLVMAGGVSANRTLRAKLAEMMQKRRGEVFYARPEFCTDNGAMIAYAGMVRLKTGVNASLGVTVRPRWPLAELPAAKNMTKGSPGEAFTPTPGLSRRRFARPGYVNSSVTLLLSSAYAFSNAPRFLSPDVAIGAECCHDDATGSDRRASIPGKCTGV